ncbi:hypothetical protein NGM10_02605 [Halorussus salilacus]|uniref:hypothetical protein n=1 Tax=Halorussus salilacus TaxID=2953750 RepID=UPI0020A16F67|nr:hypothetical protein [Halorussus salilacus]USZ68642.1 hypothetical protein NGM10_02605 [Halorussus salilacus]
MTVQSEPTPPSESEPDPERTIAQETSPTVDGDTVVTGTEPLRGQYDVRLDAPSTDIDSIEWRNSAGRIGEGRSLTRAWEPGNHTLYAVVSYADGSENIATFDDGTTAIVADPEPSVSIDSLDRFGAISGTVAGLDEYENLESIRVEVDGETVATGGPNLDGYLRDDPGRRQTLDFSHSDFTPGERYLVTVVATDERGQTTRTTESIVPVKRPEIVRSEFVNDPVDSYHPRIDASRYAAHHVLEIDLNGVDPDNLTASTRRRSENLSKIRDRGYNEEGGRSNILIHTFWSGTHPGEYTAISSFSTSEIDVNWQMSKKSSFKVTPSKPELRIEVLNDGTKDYITKDHGILVDASDSFDPDGTDLKYIWGYGAEPTKPDNTTAKFSAYERAESIVEDEHDLRAKRDFDFLDQFVPEVESREILTEGPYYGDETIEIRVETEPYHFSKRTYYDDFALDISTTGPEAEVVEWRQVEAPDSEHSGPGEDAYRYAGIVEVPASELSSTTDTPEITVSNEENEHQNVQVEFPEADVFTADGSYWSNLTVQNLKYSIERPETREVTADTKAERDDYRMDGYAVSDETETTEYVLEERTKVEDAEYETETKEFASEQNREMFLSTESEWDPAGTAQKEVTRTRRDTDWRDTNPAERPEWSDSDLWNGEFTGETRQKLVEPAEYRTERRYEYEREVEKTGTRTVTRTRRVTIPKTGTRTVTRCDIGLGCYETTETYTYYETVTRSYTTTETYTYTTTETETYWARSRLDSDHGRTGETRRIKEEDAVYKTQYEVEQKERYTDSVTVYEATREKMVAPAKYEWERAQTTEEAMLARHKANSDDDWRIGEQTTKTMWTLSKQTGVTEFESEYYENEEHVVETSATVEGDVIQTYVNEDSGETETRTTGKTEEFTYSGAKDQQEILDELRQSGGERRWCKVDHRCR